MRYPSKSRTRPLNCTLCQHIDTLEKIKRDGHNEPGLAPGFHNILKLPRLAKLGITTGPCIIDDAICPQSPHHSITFVSSLCPRPWYDSPPVLLSRSTLSLELIWPALLLRPYFLIVCQSVNLQLLQIRVDDLLPAVGTLVTISSVPLGEHVSCGLSGSVSDIR